MYVRRWKVQCAELRARRNASVMCAPGAHDLLEDTCTDGGVYRHQTYCRNCFHTKEEITAGQAQNNNKTVT